jgi:hypothetical protein
VQAGAQRGVHLLGRVRMVRRAVPPVTADYDSVEAKEFTDGSAQYLEIGAVVGDFRKHYEVEGALWQLIGERGLMHRDTWQISGSVTSQFDCTSRNIGRHHLIAAHREFACDESDSAAGLEGPREPLARQSGEQEREFAALVEALGEAPRIVAACVQLVEIARLHPQILLGSMVKKHSQSRAKYASDADVNTASSPGASDSDAVWLG